MIAVTAIIVGALSFIPPDLAETVAQNRHSGLAEPIITKPYDTYQCLLGVPVGYEHLINRDAYFVADDGRVYGPWLVVDVQHHQARDMRLDRLAADVSCSWAVHIHGSLYFFENGEQQ